MFIADLTRVSLLQDLLQRIAEREDQAVLSDALQLSLEHKGLYRQVVFAMDPHMPSG